MIAKLRILFWIGIILLFLPYIGIPAIAKAIFTVMLGVVVLVLTFKLRHGYKKLKFQLRRIDEPTTQDVIHG